MSDNDTCNAIVRVGAKQYICTERTGHARKLDTPHRDGEYTWRDTSMSGETVREL